MWLFSGVEVDDERSCCASIWTAGIESEKSEYEPARSLPEASASWVAAAAGFGLVVAGSARGPSRVLVREAMSVSGSGELDTSLSRSIRCRLSSRTVLGTRSMLGCMFSLSWATGLG